uniref:Exostosin GT47 domain-containing protein n=1 Tax=Lotharella globosa TaxID=91324 RepID=A0A7S4DUY6_9EUKA
MKNLCLAALCILQTARAAWHEGSETLSPAFLQGSEAVLQSHDLSPHKAPKIFVYPYGKFKEAFEAEHCEAERDLDERENCLYGNFWSVQNEQGEEVMIRNTEQYSNGRIYYNRALSSPHRVMDPKKADIFMIPYMWTKRKGTKCGDVGELLKNLPYLNEKNAARHFLVLPQTRGKCDFATANSGDDRETALLSQIQKLALENHGGDMPIIYPSISSGLNDTECNALLKTTKTSDRNYLVSAVFHPSKGDSTGLRTTLMELLRGQEDCVYSDPDSDIATRKENHSYPNYLLYDKPKEYLLSIKVYLHSVFSLQPPGFSVSRKGMIDSLVMGCIPVFFDERQWDLYHWHIPEWEKVSIMIKPENHGRVLEILRGMSKKMIQEYQRNILRVMPRLFLRSGNEEGTRRTVPDAFDYAITGVLNQAMRLPA